MKTRITRQRDVIEQADKRDKEEDYMITSTGKRKKMNAQQIAYKKIRDEIAADKEAQRIARLIGCGLYEYRVTLVSKRIYWSSKLKSRNYLGVKANSLAEAKRSLCSYMDTCPAKYENKELHSITRIDLCQIFVKNYRETMGEKKSASAKAKAAVSA